VVAVVEEVVVDVFVAISEVEAHGAGRRWCGAGAGAARRGRGLFPRNSTWREQRKRDTHPCTKKARIMNLV
jgi:hypothetical protein